MTSPTLDVEEGRLPPVLCVYCKTECERGADDWARDGDGAYHWSCVPHDRAFSKMSAGIEALTTAHVQHRSSDQQFLKSLGQLTEVVEKLRRDHDRLASTITNIESHIAQLADRVQALVTRADLDDFDE